MVFGMKMEFYIYENQSPVKHQYENHDPWMKKYDHKYWRERGDKASGAGHGGIDYMVLVDFSME